MNDPANQLNVRLIQFQTNIPRPANEVSPSSWTVAPPPKHFPETICSATSANNSLLGFESASTKISQSPVAAAAPVFLARAIWLMGSNTTLAPPALASSSVRSVELLLQTINSVSQLHRENSVIASRILASVSPIRRSSLKAGTTIEIFIFRIFFRIGMLCVGLKFCFTLEWVVSY